MTIDPVCKMNVQPDKAAARTDYGGQMYYFCSEACHKTFAADPQKYVGGAPGGHGHGGHQHGHK